MKNSVMYALALAVLDVIAAYSVINSNIDPNVEKYNNAIAAAEEYESRELYYYSINSYNEALGLKESYDLRMKIADLYGKGYENGEISSLESKYSTLDDVIEIYPDKAESYDMIISYLESQGNYSLCCDYVRTARNNGVSSEIIDECYDKIKKMYRQTDTVYTSVRDLGNCIEASRNITVLSDKTDADGNIIYKTDENGNEVAEQVEHPLTEYTYMYYNGAETYVYTAVNMSPPAYVVYADGSGNTVFFNKSYGNDINSEELSDKIYSRLEANGIRQCYIGDENEYEGLYPAGNQRLVLFNTKTNKYDLFNISGKKIAEGYDMLGGFSDNVAYAEKDGQKIIINTSGGSVFSQKISDVILGHGDKCSYNNRMFVKFEGDANYKLINTADLSEIGFECEDADLFSDGAAAFKKDGKYGFVDKDGSIYSDPIFDGAKSFSNGYAAFRQNDKWGFINKNGDIVVEPVYDDAMYMDSEGNALVYLDETWIMISLFYVE